LNMRVSEEKIIRILQEAIGNTAVCDIFRKRQIAVALIGLLSIMILSACTTLPEKIQRTESYGLRNTSDTYYGRTYAQILETETGESGVLLLDDGVEAFAARIALAKKAEKSIDVQYYLLNNDPTGLLFVDQLIEAADRGVRIRLLVDDIAVQGRDIDAAALDYHQNIEVRVFNPFSRYSPRILQLISRFKHSTRRMHNKLFIVDQQISVVGGRNIGDEYFDADPEMNFADLDALVIGPVVQELTDSFDLYWNSHLSYPISVLNKNIVNQEIVDQKLLLHKNHIREFKKSRYMSNVESSELYLDLLNGMVSFQFSTVGAIFDLPEKVEDMSSSMPPLLSQLFANVEQELIIISPYFVPGKKGMQRIRELVAKGVKIRLITNSLSSTDVPIVHAGYIKYRKKLIRAGVEIFEVRRKSNQAIESIKGWSGSSSASLHSKSYIFDRQKVYVGSFNLDLRSMNKNTEIGLIVESEKIATDMVDWFESYTNTQAYALSLSNSIFGFQSIRWSDTEDRNPRVWQNEPAASIWLRAGIQFFRNLPIESQL